MEWAHEAAGDASQLHPELLRYADVLASTCTGAGSRPELAELDFDLAIVDESGQIGVADALIPLVRAKRAVLVGDHMQLPPFLNSEVDAWGQHVGDPIVKSVLAKSALELLVDALPYEGFEPGAFRTPPASITRPLADGDILDLGDRSFEILHAPGHSPGSICLWEAGSGTLISGDVIVDGHAKQGNPGGEVVVEGLMCVGSRSIANANALVPGDFERF